MAPHKPAVGLIKGKTSTHGGLQNNAGLKNTSCQHHQRYSASSVRKKNSRTLMLQMYVTNGTDPVCKRRQPLSAIKVIFGVGDEIVALFIREKRQYCCIAQIHSTYNK